MLQYADASGASSGQGVSQAAPFVSKQPGIRGLVSLLECGRLAQGMAQQQLAFSTVLGLLPTVVACAGFIAGAEITTQS